jgi:hypothetical protein
VQSSVASRPRWWLWPTILSLDAPAVVVLWQAVIARSASVDTSATEIGVLGASVWLAYAADRWIEGWRLIPENIRTHRHRFYQKWRWPIFALWISILGLDLAMAVLGLSSAAFRGGLMILVPVAAYLLSHQLVHRRIRLRAPKEVCVALLLGGGAAVFAASRPGADIHGMAVPVILFVLLCFANCALISVWENEVDRSHGQTSLALQFARMASVSRALPWLIFVLSGAVWLAGVPHARSAAQCAAASGVLLGAVDLAERRMGWIAARVLADVSLMTPVAWLLLEYAR